MLAWQLIPVCCLTVGLDSSNLCECNKGTPDTVARSCIGCMFATVNELSVSAFVQAAKHSICAGGSDAQGMSGGHLI